MRAKLGRGSKAVGAGVASSSGTVGEGVAMPALGVGAGVAGKCAQFAAIHEGVMLLHVCALQSVWEMNETQS